jgi:hypothetical protein|tara:strand:- start:461 stop:736 length:276 start_codon:yes stop_codon:yes gene_type:complete
MTKQTEYGDTWGKGIGNKYTFGEINDPGTYVADWSGHLLRFPEDSVKAGRSPLMDMVGKEVLYVTKISGDPYVVLTKARQLAADLDCNVNF